MIITLTTKNGTMNSETILLLFPLLYPRNNLSSPISSSPLLKNQSSPRNSPPISSSTSHLSDDFRILKISTSSSWREIRTAYRKLARVYHPDKYDNLPKKSLERRETIFSKYFQIIMTNLDR